MKQCNAVEGTERLSVWATNSLLYAPVLIFLVFTLFLAIPQTRQMTSWMLLENRPVELATFVFLLWGAIWGLRLSLRFYRGREHPYIAVFYALFGIALLIIAMEEVAWGQWLFGFETPEFMLRINKQEETTLHNIGWFQAKTELLRLLFGIGGLLGIVVFRIPKATLIGVPPVLVTWFLVITAHASVDVYNDFVRIQQRFDTYMQITSELVELLIAIAALLYIALNAKRYGTRMEPARR